MCGHMDIKIDMYLYIYYDITYMCMYMCDLQLVIHLGNDLQPPLPIFEVPGAGERLGEEPEPGTAHWRKLEPVDG
jgi:hypothetical protein